MELTASGSAGALSHPRRLAARIDPPAIAAWTLAFSVVFYLALSNGGYDTIVRSQVGIAIWWIILLGALSGVLPLRFGAAGWTAIGLLAAFALWTGLATGWSESAERSTIELGRVVTYLGVLVLAIALQGRTAARHTIDGLACAIGLVALLAVLSRLHPQWFPVNDQIEFLGDGTARRLSYPLNYWNALAALMAIGVPLLLGLALEARTLAGRALAAATLPLSILCIYLTISRGGALALVAGIVVFVVVVPRRLPALGTLAVAGAGSAILVSAASQRDALQDGLGTATAIAQGTELIWLTVIVCSGVALLQVAMGLAARHGQRPRILAPSRRATLFGGLALLAAVSVVGLAAGAPGQISDRWREFKAPPGAIAAGDQTDVFSRLQVASGTGRYQIWREAQDANATHPWRGIGPGTFEFWHARHPTVDGYVRDAHSLYFETLAETGIVGFLLLVGLLAFATGAAIVRSFRAEPGVRIWIASAAAGLAAFMTSATFEWVWEMAAIACAAMFLVAVITAGSGDEPVVVATPPHPARSAVPLAVGLLLAIFALSAIAVPMAGARLTRETQDAAADGRLAAALGHVRDAERLQPYAATPHLQRALVLEEAGALAGAATAAKAATEAEPNNWRAWFVLARIDARRGKRTAATAELRVARRLNPRSALLGG